MLVLMIFVGCLKEYGKGFWMLNQKALFITFTLEINTNVSYKN